MILSPPVPCVAIRAEATFYTDAGRDANNHTPGQNRARYGLCATYNHARLGSRLLVSRGGVRVTVTVTDRIGANSDVDLRPLAFARLAHCRNWRKVGRLSGVRVRVLRGASR